MDSSFNDFFASRRKAASAYVEGNFTELEKILPEEGDASFLSPGGDVFTGADKVSAKYEADAGSFDVGGNTELEILHSEVGEDMAFWTGYQRAEAHMKGMEGSMPMTIRVTEVFRKINGEWKMIHRHADMSDQKH